MNFESRKFFFLQNVCPGSSEVCFETLKGKRTLLRNNFYTTKMCLTKTADGQIQTRISWCQKRLLCQLCHNHCLPTYLPTYLSIYACKKNICKSRAWLFAALVIPSTSKPTYCDCPNDPFDLRLKDVLAIILRQNCCNFYCKTFSTKRSFTVKANLLWSLL